MNSTTTTKMIDRIADILKQIEEEKKAGQVSFEYDLGWSPETKLDLSSGGCRGVKFDYERLIGFDKMIIVEKIAPAIKKIKDEELFEIEKQLNKMDWSIRNKRNNDFVDLCDKRDGALRRISWLNGILRNIEEWKPVNCYYGTSSTYNTKTHNVHRQDAVVEKALDDYKLFADEINKKRGTPIRNITIRNRINGDGSRTLEASWSIRKEEYTYYYFNRNYQILPEFKFKDGISLESIAEEERKEKEKKEAKKKALADKKAEREKDPVYVLTKKIEAVEDERSKFCSQFHREHEKKYPYVDRLTRTPEQEKQKAAEYEDYRNKYEEFNKQEEALRKERTKVKKELKKKATSPPA